MNNTNLILKIYLRTVLLYIYIFFKLNTSLHFFLARKNKAIKTIPPHAIPIKTY